MFITEGDNGEASASLFLFAFMLGGQAEKFFLRKGLTEDNCLHIMKIDEDDCPQKTEGGEKECTFCIPTINWRVRYRTR